MNYLTNFEGLKDRNAYQTALLSLTKGRENSPLVKLSVFSRNEEANRAKMTTIVKNFINYGENNEFFKTKYDYERADKLKARLKLAPQTVVSNKTLVVGALAATTIVAAGAAYYFSSTGTTLPLDNGSGFNTNTTNATNTSTGTNTSINTTSANVSVNTSANVSINTSANVSVNTSVNVSDGLIQPQVNYSFPQYSFDASGNTTTSAQVPSLADYSIQQCPLVPFGNSSMPVYGTSSATAAKVEEVCLAPVFTCKITEKPLSAMGVKVVDVIKLPVSSPAPATSPVSTSEPTLVKHPTPLTITTTTTTTTPSEYSSARSKLLCQATKAGEFVTGVAMSGVGVLSAAASACLPPVAVLTGYTSIGLVTGGAIVANNALNIEC